MFYVPHRRRREGYRAAAGIDCELDAADLGRKLDMPILVLWGAASSVGKRFADPLGLWRLRANDIRGEALPTGHYVNEEAPDQVLEWFFRFFAAKGHGIRLRRFPRAGYRWLIATPAPRGAPFGGP